MCPPSSPDESTNFLFLKEYDPLFLRLCVSAESNYHADPNTCVIKLRQFGEAIVKTLAAAFNVGEYAEKTQAELLRVLQEQRFIDRNVADLLHFLRREGNVAAHEYETSPQQAKSALKIARELALWFHRSFGSCPAPWCKKGSVGHRLRQGMSTSQAATADRLTFGLSPTSARVSSVM